MIQCAEGVGIVPSRPLVPVIKRSVTHDEKNYPCKHCAAFSSRTHAAPQLVRRRHLPEGTGAMMQRAEGVGVAYRSPLVPVIKRSNACRHSGQRLGLYGAAIYRRAWAR